MFRKNQMCRLSSSSLVLSTLLLVAGCGSSSVNHPSTEGGVDSAGLGIDATSPDLPVAPGHIDAQVVDAVDEADRPLVLDVSPDVNGIDASLDTGEVGSEKCGDGVCGVGETQDNCCSDCGCKAGAVCGQNSCMIPIGITAGGYHSCLLVKDGTVLCWGSNGSGELGNGATSKSGIAKVSGLTNATAISAGAAFTCALLGDQTVKCWGENSAGQLGNGTKSASSLPVSVSNLLGVTAIATGYDYACAVVANGGVKCWGNNSAGQLGDTSTAQASLPVQVNGLSGVSSLAAGFNSTCALLADHTVRCWGDNSDGQLGIGTGAIQTNPVQVSKLDSATSVTAIPTAIPGGTFAGETTSFCAVLADGSVKCWGSNLLGQLGTGSSGSPHPQPTPVVGLEGVQSMAGGTNFACAVTSSGTVACWGYAGEGQIGNGTSDGTVTTPALVSGLANAVAVAAGTYHACALLSDGSVQCWGSNTYKQLGNSTARRSAVPISVFGDGGNAQPTTPDAGIDAPDRESGYAHDAAVDGTYDAGAADTGPQICSTPGATVCKNPYRLRTCQDGVWVDKLCEGVQTCSPDPVASCQAACPDLNAPSGALVVCYMPFDPSAGYTAGPFVNSKGVPFTTAYVQSDRSALPDDNIYGAAMDSLDLAWPQNAINPPVTNVAPVGLVWHTPAPTRWFGRIYIWGYLGLKEFVAKYGSRPAKITLSIKARKLADSSAQTPVPLFYLWNGRTSITSDEDESASLTPTNDWSIMHRAFPKDEIDAMSIDSDKASNWEVDFASGPIVSGAAPTGAPENIEIAWYAVTVLPPS